MVAQQVNVQEWMLEVAEKLGRMEAWHRGHTRQLEENTANLRQMGETVQSLETDRRVARRTSGKWALGVSGGVVGIAELARYLGSWMGVK